MRRRTFVTAAAGLPVLAIPGSAATAPSALTRYLAFDVREIERDWNEPGQRSDIAEYRRRALALLRDVTAENPDLAYGWDERGSIALVLMETASTGGQTGRLREEVRLCANRLTELACPKMAASMLGAIRDRGGATAAPSAVFPP